LKGDTGDTGPQGPAGATGATGPQGPAGADGASTWEAISGKPTTFAPSAHTHPATEVTGLAPVATSGSASDLSTGTLALARLDPLVARDDLNNNFTAGQTITASANTSALTASYSVTGANTTPLLDLSGTWNTTGVARGILLNITDTASSATSRLLDLQVGGTSRFTVLKSGQFSTPSDLYTNSVALTAGVRIALNSTLGFTLSSNPAVNPDTILARDAANTLALRNGGTAGTPVPQTFRLYNYTDAGLTNFERGFMRWNSNVLEIGTEAGGTGTANRSVRLLIGTQSSGVVFSAAGSGVDINARSFTTGANMTLVGSNISGLATCNYTSASTDPTTTTITNGNWQVHRNTTSGTVRLWANNNGTMVSVALS
jgi:hypothetical protein